MPFRFTLSVAIGLLTGSFLPAQEQDQKFANTLSRAIEIIAEDHVKPIPQSQLTLWAIHGLYDKFKKPIPLKLVRRLKKLEQAKEADIQQLLHDAYAALRADKDDGTPKALDICVSAIFRKLEPGAHPECRSGLIRRDFACILYCPDLFGIGLKVKSEPESGMLLVVTPMFKGPAFQAGIRAGDLITHIRISTDLHGKPLVHPKEFSTKAMLPKRARELFLGKRGTTVTLKVIRAK